MCRGELVPLDRLLEVLGCVYAELVRDSQVVLGVCVTAFCGESIVLNLLATCVGSPSRCVSSLARHPGKLKQSNKMMANMSRACVLTTPNLTSQKAVGGKTEVEQSPCICSFTIQPCMLHPFIDSTSIRSYIHCPAICQPSSR